MVEYDSRAYEKIGSSQRKWPLASSLVGPVSGFRTEWSKSKDHIVIWEEQLIKEKRDVEKLKTHSFTSFLYDLMNKKAEKLLRNKNCWN
ncbi:hypothetical protein QFZ77_004187 [Paenibacillus sp. V4I3]|uniref:hypothetical protein n=1 Tax=unclassified Paenibacillus TaxID=185978 RepID=UPI002787B622|nr:MULTISPECIES: hypothetical protein [unclassified Paenibacillus]MDQ0875528.1 hypothetical protein [Paenibacillus sp. V4I3]MDQ0888391.1 hypothetical protein [Paenibacillus sp. V4I9]